MPSANAISLRGEMQGSTSYLCPVPKPRVVFRLTTVPTAQEDMSLLASVSPGISRRGNCWQGRLSGSWSTSIVRIRRCWQFLQLQKDVISVIATQAHGHATPHTPMSSAWLYGGSLSASCAAAFLLWCRPTSTASAKPREDPDERTDCRVRGSVDHGHGALFTNEFMGEHDLLIRMQLIFVPSTNAMPCRHTHAKIFRSAVEADVVRDNTHEEPVQL
ncbi:hypothetical protein C8T65DRAFT_102121 [Cerioporus squamosus]|nr:hypothetical protein C8T65DRAFT_102121 [Cerioporus squamosus]